MATAEGAILRAMESLETTLVGADCLVVGYGRIGKLLARRLEGLGARVSVAARKPADLAWIEAMGYLPVPSGELADHLAGRTVVFNTAPALLLGEAQLRRLDPGVLVIDLASAPGGVDFQAAERLGVKTLWARFLPGITAPQSAAEAIGLTIEQMVKENV